MNPRLAQRAAADRERAQHREQVRAKSVKAVIAIESCLVHQDRVFAQFNTWAKDSPIPVVVFTGLELGVPDDYNHLPEKTQAICQWAVENKLDHLFKIDSDTYVHPERLLVSGFAKHDYAGYLLDWLKPEYGFVYCSGPHYWLSRKAFTILAEEDWSRFLRPPGLEHAEDFMVGRILLEHGIWPHHDPRYSAFDPVLADNDLISNHLSSRRAYKIELMYSAHRAAMGTE